MLGCTWLSPTGARGGLGQETQGQLHQSADGIPGNRRWRNTPMPRRQREPEPALGIPQLRSSKWQGAHSRNRTGPGVPKLGRASSLGSRWGMSHGTNSGRMSGWVPQGSEKLPPCPGEVPGDRKQKRSMDPSKKNEQALCPISWLSEHRPCCKPRLPLEAPMRPSARVHVCQGAPRELGAAPQLGMLGRRKTTHPSPSGGPLA